jgi:hypothetical protein
METSAAEQRQLRAALDAALETTFDFGIRKLKAPRHVGAVAAITAQHLEEPAGHLVIINLSARPLQLPADGPADVQPGYLDLPDARIYLMQVRGLPREAASRQGKTQPLVVQRTQLVGG